MSDEEEVAEEFAGSSGDTNPYEIELETREIVVGFGVDFHDWAVVKQEFDTEVSLPFEITDDDTIEFENAEQGIRYVVRATESKQEFRDAMETEDLIVIYAGHSRYGRGCCFGQVPGNVDEKAGPGEHWEAGSDEDDGLLRWAFPYVSVHLSDIDHHGYTFRPVSAAEAAPPREECHPEARKAPVKIELPEDLRLFVDPECADDEHLYWGFKGAEPSVLLRAGWTDTHAAPFDLGAVDLRCRCFCHFGCSSRLHFRPLLRGGDFKAWERDESGNANFAYFTTEPAPPPRTALAWIGALSKSKKTRAGEPWLPGLKETVEIGNRRLKQLNVIHPGSFAFKFF